MVQARSNVVAFNSNRLARKRTLSVESADLLVGCRDMALVRICAALSQAFDKIEDELFDLAGKSTDREAQNMYLDARNQTREKRTDIEATFRNEFVSFFANKIKIAGEEIIEQKSVARDDPVQLSLIEDDAFTESLAVNDIARRLADGCDEELGALSQRMGFLLSDPELTNDNNPIAPAMVVRALKIACDQMASGFQTKLTVLRLVEQHMASEMLCVYRDLNMHLVAKQILPVIRPMFRKAQTQIVANAGTHSTGNASIAQKQAGDGATPNVVGAMGNVLGASDQSGISTNIFLPTGVMPGNSAVEIFQTLQQLMAGSISFGGGTALPKSPQVAEHPHDAGFKAAPGNSLAAGAFLPLGVSPIGNQDQLHNPIESGGNKVVANQSIAVNARATVNVLIVALSQLQQQSMSKTRQVAERQAGQNVVESETGVPILNVIHEIKTHGFAQESSQVDTRTIDIVAMLFDYVFDDNSIPDSIKALIARVQIPVLKAAIIDKTFFSKKNHPARRLLDILANASVAFGDEVSHDDPLYKKIELIVNRVHDEFETDIALFDKMIAEFEAFSCEWEAANAHIVEQSARAMHDREKCEMARLVAQAETGRRMPIADLPSPVTSMLNGPWARVLERVYLRDGGRSARFLEALETGEQLVWSVQPKIDAGQRRDLVAALPLLLKRLQEGLDIATVEKKDRDLFFSALVDCHAAAVRAGLRGESVVSLFAAVPDNKVVAPHFELLIAEEAARAEAAAGINRTGVARIQFTKEGVKIEELTIAGNGGAATISATDAFAAAIQNTKMTSLAKHVQIKIEAESIIDWDKNPGNPIAHDLKRGTWVEFLHEGRRKIRAKLSWVSPLKGVYLFTNPGAKEALSIAPDALQRQLRMGAARVLEESSLVDRAVDRMIISLSGAA